MALRNMLSALRMLAIRSNPQVISVRSSVLQCKCSRFIQPGQISRIHTSSNRWDLSEFIDDQANWGQETVKVGRPWHLSELRLKSNEDLHKLWYVLLKERNMLLTMEAEYKRQVALFPSPERIDKVEESMENILSVVTERNDAHNLLETGSTGRPAARYVRNFLGLKVKRTPKEFAIPQHMNMMYRLLHPPYRKSMVPYINLYREKLRHWRKREQMRKVRHLKALRTAFPDMEK